MEHGRIIEGHGAHIADAMEYARKVIGSWMGKVRTISRTWTEHDRKTNGLYRTWTEAQMENKRKRSGTLRENKWTANGTLTERERNIAGTWAERGQTWKHMADAVEYEQKNKRNTNGKGTEHLRNTTGKQTKH